MFLLLKDLWPIYVTLKPVFSWLYGGIFSLLVLLIQSIIIIWKKREFDLSIKKAKKSACRFKVKVHLKKAATAHIVFSVTFWEAPSWCVLWTGLVAADSGSGWIRKFFGKDFWYRTQNVSKAAVIEGGAALLWHHTVGEQKGNRIPPYSKPARIWFCFWTKCVSRAGKGWTVRQSLLEECCCQQSVWPKQYRSLFFPFNSPYRTTYRCSVCWHARGKRHRWCDSGRTVYFSTNKNETWDLCTAEKLGTWRAGEKARQALTFQSYKAMRCWFFSFALEIYSFIFSSCTIRIKPMMVLMCSIILF